MTNIDPNTCTFVHPCLYAGDFNCQHADWGYASNSPDGVYFVDCASKNGVDLLHNPKDAPSFFSGRWNSGTNLALAFLSLRRDSNRSHVLEKFPRSQHRPSLITACKMMTPVPSTLYKRFIFERLTGSNTAAPQTNLPRTSLHQIPIT